MFRKKMNKSKDRKVFTSTASKVNFKNQQTGARRGGYRL